jgi:hypothetical protein
MAGITGYRFPRHEGPPAHDYAHDFSPTPLFERMGTDNFAEAQVFFFTIFFLLINNVFFLFFSMPKDLCQT